MKPVKIGLLGLGTVGGGTVNVLARNREEISRRAGRAIDVVRAAVRDPGKDRICATDAFTLCEDPLEVVCSSEISIVVEVIGGTGLARDLVLRAIANGKHVVTANKALIALHGNEVFAAAHEKGVTVAFESAVAGGVPIIKAIREGLAGNRIDRIAGIVNGTSNYILTEMREHRRDFGDVLAEAQRLGYAEADPTFDVEGIDAPTSSRSSQPSPSAFRSNSRGCIRRASPTCAWRTSPMPSSSATVSATSASPDAGRAGRSCGSIPR